MSESIAAVREAVLSSRASRIWYGILSLLVLIGLYAFARQTIQGEYLTNLTNDAPWGLYIVGLMFFVGISAGATIVGVMVHAFGREDYAPLATRALLVALLALLVSVAFVAVDAGRIERMLLVPWVWRNPTSMFFYTSLSYYIFGGLLIAELYYTVKVTKGTANERDKSRAKWLAPFAAVFALVVFVGVDGALFAVVKAREFWNSSLLLPHFVVTALASGASLMILVAVITSRIERRELVSKKTLSHMGLMLGCFVVAAALMDFFDFVVFSYGDKPAGNDASAFLSGSNLPFSILHVGGYIAALAILVSRRGREVPRLTVAAGLALVAVAAYRYNLVTVGLEVHQLPFLPAKSYSPSLIELAVAAGIIAGALLVYSVLAQVLPMEEDAEAEPVEAAPAPGPAGGLGQPA